MILLPKENNTCVYKYAKTRKCENKGSRRLENNSRKDKYPERISLPTQSWWCLDVKLNQIHNWAMRILPENLRERMYVAAYMEEAIT